MSDDHARPVDLVEHARFVRSLALHLLHHDADADDATQETLLRSLEHPPRRGPGLRAWTGTVLLNVIRMERRTGGRRARRERVAARTEAVRAPDDAVSRAEILSRVAAAVRALPAEELEVVILRHYEGLPPRAIAKRLRLDVEHVKRRLRRSHDRLRSMLDEGRGGNVEDWRRALGGLLGLPAGSRPAGPQARPDAAAVATAASLAGSKVLALAAPALLAIGVGIWLYSTHSGGDAPGPPSAELASTPDNSGVMAARPAGSGRAARPASEAVAIDAPASAAPNFRVSGRISEPSGTPVAGASVRVRLARGEVIDESALVVSAKNGG